MTNEIEYGFGVNGQPTRSWRERFVDYLDFPQSRISVMVQTGIEQGLAGDSVEGRRLLAHDLGSVLDAVYVPETGGEVHVDDLTPDQMHERTGIAQERQQALIALMVKSGMVKSRAVETKRRRNQVI